MPLYVLRWAGRYAGTSVTSVILWIHTQWESRPLMITDFSLSLVFRLSFKMKCLNGEFIFCRKMQQVTNLKQTLSCVSKWNEELLCNSRCETLFAVLDCFSFELFHLVDLSNNRTIWYRQKMLKAAFSKMPTLKIGTFDNVVSNTVTKCLF